MPRDKPSGIFKLEKPRSAFCTATALCLRPGALRALDACRLVATLGIQIQRIKPGNPQQNGRHERMHRTLKKEATKPASFNFLQQQEHFDRFIEVYNHERARQALGGAYPGDLYTPSARLYEPPPEL